jgi:hypothetical protein
VFICLRVLFHLAPRREGLRPLEVRPRNTQPIHAGARVADERGAHALRAGECNALFKGTFAVAKESSLGGGINETLGGETNCPSRNESTPSQDRYLIVRQIKLMSYLRCGMLYHPQADN